MVDKNCPCGTQRCYGEEACEESRKEMAPFHKMLEDMTSTGKVRKELLDLVVEERKRQDEKWGVQNHGNPIWSMILGEEVGEVQKEAWEIWSANIDIEKGIRNLKEELIQVAAVAIAWYECIERNE